MVLEVMSDIKSLARERPLVTSEILDLNDTYGHAHVLKKYANIKQEYQIKGVLEHPVMLFDQIYEGEISYPLPAHFTMSKYRFPYLRQLTNKALFAIGPSIHYAMPLFSEQEIEEIKKALGKTLLVFIPHSAMQIIVSADHQKIISHIKEIEKEFDNILICLGWKEVLLDVDKIYRAEGYTCVTAGHSFDLNFLPRLKSLILISSHTMSFGFGTHVGFCIHLNRPHWIVPIKISSTAPKKIQKGVYYRPTPLSRNQINWIHKKLKGPIDYITDEQREIVDMMWGSSEVKSPKELRVIFKITEDMFKSRFFPCNKRDPLMICQIIDYIEKGDTDMAKSLLKYAKNLNFHPGWILYIKGLINLEEGKLEEVEKIISSLKRYGEFFKQRADILLKLKDKNEMKVHLLNDIFNFYPRPQYYKHVKLNLVWRQEEI